MKIAYFLDSPHFIGGSNKVLLTQAYIMRNRGHKVIVIIPEDINGHASEYDKICQIYELDTITSNFTVTTCMEGIDIMSVFSHYDSILRLVKSEKVDLIHSTQINIVAEMVSRKLQIPHLMNIYQTDIEMFNIKWLNVYPQYHSADSELFSKRWKDGLHIKSRCIRVSYESKKSYMVHKSDDTILNILSIGILAERKKQLEIIKFILICKNNGIQIRLRLLGNHDTPYGKDCERFVKQNNLENEVIFQGFVLDIENYFMQTDLMILASEVESFPGVIVESMAYKVPILSTAVAGIPELLEDEYNAFLSTSFYAQDLYEAFRRFLIYKDSGKIQDIIECAYQTYIQNHTYDMVGKKLEDYYYWILKDYDSRELLIGIRDIKEIFKNFIIKNHLKQENPHTKKNLWFLYHLWNKLNLKQPRKLAIWGAGYWGKLALDWIKGLDYENVFIGFIDTYKEGMYLGYPIQKAEKQIIISCDVILLAIGNMNGCLQIMKTLDDCGKRRNEDYFLMLNGPNRI